MGKLLIHQLQYITKYMKEKIIEHIIESFEETVPDFKNFDIVLNCEIFNRTCSFQCYELANKAHYFEFFQNDSLVELLFNCNEELMETSNRFNKMETIFFKNGDIKLELIWDQVLYDANQKAHEKNMKRKQR